MLTRVLTAVVLAPAVAALVWFSPPEIVAAGAAVVALVALREFFLLGERVGLRAFQKWTMFSAAALFFAQYAEGLRETHRFGLGFFLVREARFSDVSIEAVLLLFLLGAAAIGLGTRRPLPEVLPAVSISSAGLLFIALPFSYVVRINELERIGRELLLFTLCLVWAGDTLAYLVGRSLGRMLMAPVLSPKKTWEGAFANLLGSLLVAVLFARWLEVDVHVLLVVAGLGNVAGQMGDLMESAYKRGAAVKDSGALLPGHGGMLDRVDALIFAAPVVWFTYQWLLAR